MGLAGAELSHAKVGKGRRVAAPTLGWGNGHEDDLSRVAGRVGLRRRKEAGVAGLFS